jgi:hypothetical protein
MVSDHEYPPHHDYTEMNDLDNLPWLLNMGNHQACAKHHTPA